ncbi:hypothetical protein [Luteibaculum oceani]|uniref:Uncharacterized protein n=1 Tax=Luteibaculum oceani TaxID=1294296 RepID=A0A5C6V9V9_9FLAO|nr:hypothetical protein [Luteibaculum oceani]TXC81600.1 hypothetical protein FRX97_03510 [Luteibaculum oceani]
MGCKFLTKSIQLATSCVVRFLFLAFCCLSSLLAQQNVVPSNVDNSETEQHWSSAVLWATEGEIKSHKISLELIVPCGQPVSLEKMGCAVFESVGYPKVDVELIKEFEETVNLANPAECDQIASLPCYKRVKYSGDVDLAKIPGGYIAVWQSTLDGMTPSSPFRVEGVSLTFVIDDYLPSRAFQFSSDFYPLQVCSNKEISYPYPNLSSNPMDSLLLSGKGELFSTRNQLDAATATLDAHVANYTAAENKHDFPISAPPYSVYGDSNDLISEPGIDLQIDPTQGTIIVRAYQPGEILWSANYNRYRKKLKVGVIKQLFFTRSL